MGVVEDGEDIGGVGDIPEDRFELGVGEGPEIFGAGEGGSDDAPGEVQIKEEVGLSVIR